MCADFQTKQTTLFFWAQICPKINLGDRNFKNLSLDSESAPPRYRVSQFSFKMDNFEFCDLNLGKLPKHVRYLVSILLRALQRAGGGWNGLVGGGKSWVEVKMRWVQVDGAGWRWREVDGAAWRWVHGLVILMGITKPCTQVHPAPSTQLPPAPPCSIHLQLSHLSLYTALYSTLNNIRANMSHIIGRFPQI